MSQTTPIATNPAPITGPSTRTRSRNAPPRTQSLSTIYSETDIAAIRHMILNPDEPLPTGTVTERLRDLYFRSKFAYEFVQKVHRRQMIFFWRKKKYGLQALRASLRENMDYFRNYEDIAVEAPGLALRISGWGAEYQRHISTVLALADGRQILLRYEILARMSERCRVEVKKLLKEASEARDMLMEDSVPNTEEVTALPVVTDPAVISETKEETTLPKENEGEKVRVRIARVPTYEIIVVKKRRGAYQGNQVGAAGIPGGNQGSEATSGADTLVAIEPVGVANNRRAFEEAGHGMAANGGISCGKLEKTSKGDDNQAGE